MSISTIDFSKPLNAALPRQQLTLAEKLKNTDKFGISDWMKDCMDSLEAIGRYQFYNNLTLRDNYRIVSKEFNLEHYYDSSEMYDLSSAITQEFGIPYHLKHYDITGKAVSQLVGEFLKRPDLATVRASGVDVDNEKIRVKTDLMLQYMQQEIKKEIDRKLLAQGLDPARNEFNSEEEKAQYQQEIQKKYQELTPKSIEKYMRYDYRTAAEHWGQAIISNDRVRFNFRELEKVEFTDMLIADRCFSHIYITPTGYNIEYWNPINTFFHQVPDIPHIETGDYVGRVFYLNKAQAIDRYGWRMQREQQEQLYPQDSKDKQNGNVYGEFFTATMFPFPAYRDYSNIVTSIGYDPWNQSPVGNLPMLNWEDTNTGYPNYQFASGDLVQITEGYWRSQRRIGQLCLMNPDTGEIEKTIVDDNFDPKLFGIEELEHTSFQDARESQPPNSIVWTWVTHIWQGGKINANFAQSIEDRDRNAIYFDIRPCPFQFKGDYTPFSPKLPVVGGVFNNRNAKSNSLVDLLKPYQIAYNAFMNLAYGIAQRNNGKMALLDTRILSNFKDWGGEEALNKAMVIGRELGIIPLDTSPQNVNGSIQFNQNTVLDLDDSEKVERLMKLAMVWEDQGFRQIGITPQRQGQVQASESATGVEQSVAGSYAITEPYFENFYNYKRRKLKMILDLAQFLASKEQDIVQSYITSDLGTSFIKITGTELMLSDLGVNIDTSQETVQELELAKQMAIQNNTSNLPMSKLISMIRLKSIADIQKSLEQGEAEQAQQVQAQQEHEKELVDMQNKAKAEEEDKKRAFEAEQNELDRESRLREAAIKTMGFDTDTQDNGIIDVAEQAKIALDQSKMEADASHKRLDLFNKQIESANKSRIEKEKLAHDKQMKKEEITLKKKEMENKLAIEDKKQKQIETQNKSQEKMSKEKHAAELAIKQKDLEIKKLELEKQKGAVKHEISEAKSNADTTGEINNIKKHEAKELSKDKIEVSKNKKKIALKVDKFLGNKKIADAKKPKPKPKK